jgi:hypothetical protein
MKKLIFLIAFVALTAVTFGQRVYTVNTKTVTSAATLTWSEKFYTTGPWSLHYNFRNFNQADATLTIYSTDNPDSTLYDLLWVDQNLNGVNDNPWTLADSSLTIWGESFPFKYRVCKLTKGTVSTGKKLYETVTK